MNAIRIIHPYWDRGALVFDDPDVGLRKEPFVAGADEALHAIARSVDPSCEERFTLIFSDQPFPGSQFTAKLLRQEGGGHWYEIEEAGYQGWLCPALLRYFDAAPERIYAQIRPQAR